MASRSDRKGSFQQASIRGRAAFIALVLIVPAALAAVSHDAVAQEQQRRRWFSLRDLFMPRRERVQPDVIVVPPASNTPSVNDGGAKIQRVRKPTPKKRPAPREPEIAIAPKAEDARTVLVIGDFVGTALANGLNQAYANNTHVAIVDRTQANSGIVRQAQFDWSAQLKAMVDQQKPAAILVMLGANDRQSIRIDDESQPMGSQKWTDEYVSRVDGLAKALVATKLPFAWFGLPSFKSARMSDDFLVLNELYRASVSETPGQFIDVWDGFVDENGAFSTSGPDVTGQPVRLRANDGINFTQAGKRKLAFFAEKPLAKMLGLSESGEPLVTAIPDKTLPATSDKSRDRTPPMALNDPELDGGAELLGAAVKPGTAKQPAAAMRDASSKPVAGRADDFLWDRQLAGPASDGESTASTH